MERAKELTERLLDALNGAEEEAYSQEPPMKKTVIFYGRLRDLMIGAQLPEEQQRALYSMIDVYIETQRRELSRKRFVETFWGRASIVFAGILAFTAFWAWLLSITHYLGLLPSVVTTPGPH